MTLPDFDVRRDYLFTQEGPLWQAHRTKRPLLEGLSELPNWALIAGLSIIFTATSTAAVMIGMPHEQKQAPETSSSERTFVEPPPVGRTLVPFIDTPNVRNLMVYGDMATWVDCSDITTQTPNKLPVRGIKLYANPDQGSARLTQPQISAPNVEPAFPVSEPMTATDLIRLKTQVGESLWAVDPKSTIRNLARPSTLQTLYTLVEEITEGRITKGASLAGDLNACEVKPISYLKRNYR